MALFGEVDSIDEATEEVLRASRYECSSNSDRSEMLADVFDRVLQHCPRLLHIAGDATALESRDAIHLLLAPMGIAQ